MHFQTIAILVVASTTLAAAQPTFRASAAIARDVTDERTAYEIVEADFEPALDELESTGDEEYPASRPITIRDTSRGDRGSKDGNDVANTASGADGSITNEDGSCKSSGAIYFALGLITSGVS